MCYIAQQWFIWTTWNLSFRIYFYIAPISSQKITIIFCSTFVTGVKHTSWCLLRPWCSFPIAPPLCSSPIAPLWSSAIAPLCRVRSSVLPLLSVVAPALRELTRSPRLRRNSYSGQSTAQWVVPQHSCTGSSTEDILSKPGAARPLVHPMFQVLQCITILKTLSHCTVPSWQLDHSGQWTQVIV